MTHTDLAHDGADANFADADRREHATSLPAERVELLARECPHSVHLAGTPGYDAGRFAWNVAIDQRPAAVALPTSVEEIAHVVRTAARLGLRVTTQATGHAAGILAQHHLDDVVLLRTSALRGVHVDPERRTARIEAGAIWQDVVDAAAPHGLAVMHGSAHDVGVIGYTLGGGLSWYARKHGLASSHVVGIELVDAGGEVVRADEHSHPDLFWALRGGGGSFGVVTTIEISLLPVADVVAGMVTWDVARAPEVMRAFADFSPTAPEEVTASCRVMRFPPFEELPPFLRGRSLVVLDAAVLLEDEGAAALLAPFRALGPEVDTFPRVPSASLTTLHMDPPEPTPSTGDAVILSRLDADVIDALLSHVGEGAETTVVVAELRLLGGALARPAVGGGAVDHVPGSHVAFLLSALPVPELAPVADAEISKILIDLAPYATGRRLLNFADRGGEVASGYDRDAWQRLRSVKRQVDPAGLFLANHAVE